MVKKMSLLILGVMLVGFCVTIIPASRAEAAAIKCSGWHKHKRESGTAFCRGQNHNQTDVRGFRTSSSGSYSAPELRRLPTDWYTVRVAGGCMASAVRYNVYASGYSTTYVTNFNY